MEAALKGTSLVVRRACGIRALSDYLPPTVSRSAEYQKILELERKLGSRLEFAAVARYAQYLVGRASLAAEPRT